MVILQDLAWFDRRNSNSFPARVGYQPYLGSTWIQLKPTGWNVLVGFLAGSQRGHVHHRQRHDVTVLGIDIFAAPDLGPLAHWGSSNQPNPSRIRMICCCPLTWQVGCNPWQLGIDFPHIEGYHPDFSCSGFTSHHAFSIWILSWWNQQIYGWRIFSGSMHRISSQTEVSKKMEIALKSSILIGHDPIYIYICYFVNWLSYIVHYKPSILWYSHIQCGTPQLQVRL